MIPSDQVQAEILTAQLKCADLSYTNLVALQGGNTLVNWKPIRNGQRAINVVQRQLNLNDTASDQFLKAYACLSAFVGTYAGGTIDPNAQNPGIIIDVINPASYIPPIPSIAWSDFDPTTQNPDGNRYIYYNTAWKGANPVLSLISPVETALTLDVDYTLISTGGIQLIVDLSGAGSPGIADGMFLRATSYVLS